MEGDKQKVELHRGKFCTCLTAAPSSFTPLYVLHLLIFNSLFLSVSMSSQARFSPEGRELSLGRAVVGFTVAGATAEKVLTLIVRRR